MSGNVSTAAFACAWPAIVRTASASALVSTEPVNLAGRFLDKIKQRRRIATRHSELAVDDVAGINPTPMRI